MNFKQYKDSILNEEKEVKLATIEGAVDFILEQVKSKKEALKYIETVKNSFINKNKKKIKDMLNKLPDQMFKW